MLKILKEQHHVINIMKIITANIIKPLLCAIPYAIFYIHYCIYITTFNPPSRLWDRYYFFSTAGEEITSTWKGHMLPTSGGREEYPAPIWGRTG